MYFNYQGVWTGGDGVVGATSPASTFYFAEGTCRPNFDPYLCIQNPGAGAATRIGMPVNRQAVSRKCLVVFIGIYSFSRRCISFLIMSLSASPEAASELVVVVVGAAFVEIEAGMAA